MDGGTGLDARSTRTRGRPSADHAGTASVAAGAAHELSRLARDLEEQVDPTSTMEHVVRWAVDVIPGAEHASVSLVRRRRTITSAAATGEMGRAFDELQQTVGQGPCLDSMYEHQTERVDDLAAQTRWPALARDWATAGARSALCLQLFVRDQDLGALNVLSGRVGAFDDDSEQWGLLVASHAAVAVSGALKLEGLNRANVNRTVIGQAEGILMERLEVDAEVAFALLARISQDTNRKLHAVAEDLVRTGEISLDRRRR